MGLIKKSNVVKCLLFILCFSFLITDNSSAIRSGLYAVSITRLDYVRAPSNGSTSSLGNILRNSVLPLVGDTVPVSGSLGFQSAKFTFANSFTVNKGDKFSLDVNFRLTYPMSSELSSGPVFASVVCPITNSRFYIDNCSVEQVDSISSLSGIRLQVGTTYINSDEVDSVINSYYIMRIEGHWAGDDNSTVSDFQPVGRFISFYNPSSTSIMPVGYIIQVGTFNRWKEIDDSAQAEAAEKEIQSADNIENQSSSDIQDSDNQQTTSLIGVLSNFLSAFQNVSATNCQLELPFPDFLGGDTTVDVCQGKDKAPVLISAGSSLLLILTFIPLAYIMLRMIYNEIRSFTNG